MARGWKKAARKEIEELLRKYNAAGWTIEDPPKYYTVRCPCGRHQRWIHLTPSGGNYVRNALAWLYRQECSKKEGS